MPQRPRPGHVIPPEEKTDAVDLDRDAIRLSFDTKVIGPLMLAKHLAPRMNPGGSFVIFSGVAAAKCQLCRR